MAKRSARFNGIGRGGFSYWLWSTPEVQQYIAGPVFGYVGSSGRTRERDEIVEHALWRRGLSLNEAGTWLTSKDGRWLMDQVGRKDDPDKFSYRVHKALGPAKKLQERVRAWRGES